MSLSRRLLSLIALMLPIGLAACPASVDSHEEGALVVGLQSDDFGALVGSVHVVAKLDGVVVRDETYPSASKLAQELTFTGAPGARLQVTTQALSPDGAAVVVRDAETNLVAAAHGRKLLRIYLESRCLLIAPSPLTCADPTTCIAGACAPREVSESSLEDYEPGWAAAPPDICRPAQHGAPTVMIGTGQTAYGPLAEGQVLQLEKGPQGGHHIWIAARMKNLRQSGSTTLITSRLLDDPAPVPPISFVFTFDRDEGSYCAIWGLRYQIDAGASDTTKEYRRFLGKKLEVTVEVKDSTGASARDTKVVQIADKLLCPDGTDSCNAVP